MEKTPPKVFISYAHDTERFADDVLAFANKLRSDIIDANIDQYEESPPEGWPRWMERQVRESEFVLVICTKMYMQKITALDSSQGRGVNWEVGIIYQHIYDSFAQNTKFIPVIFPGSDTDDVPIPLKGATFYYPGEESSYKRLLNRLLGIKSVEKPAMGQPLPEKRRKNMFVSSHIDLELWDQAKWKGSLFLFKYEEKPLPLLGLLCLNKLAIQGIFSGWHRTKGDDEYFNELRISIIEGKLPDEKRDGGYFVYISSDIDNFVERIGDDLLPQDDRILVISRFQRMNPDPGAKGLETFKALYKNAGYCYLVPAHLNDQTKPINGDNIDFDTDYQIKFKNIHFKHISEIGPKDFEVAVLPDSKKKNKRTK